MRARFCLLLATLVACSDPTVEGLDATAPTDRGVAADLGFPRDAGFEDVFTEDVVSRDLGLEDAIAEDALAEDAGAEDATGEDAAAEDALVPDAGNACDSNPCFPGVSCTNDGAGFDCGPCPIGYSGDGVTCVDFDACASMPCLSGTTCTDLTAPDPGFTCAACMGPACPILRALAGPDQEIISGTVVVLEGDATGYNGAFTCAWTNSANSDVFTSCTATVTVSAATVFTLTVTDASGLMASDEVAIRIVPLLADAGPDSNILTGETATLTASWTGASCPNGSCISCVWRSPNGQVLARTCTATASPPVTSQYSVTVSDSISGISDSDSTTVFITNLPANLCGWNVVILTSNEYPTAGAPNYVCTPDGRARRQTVNGQPSIVLSDLEIENARIVGYIGVETGADDDLIGFLWGWENPVHYYLLLWKQITQNWTPRCGNALSGIAVKKVDGSTLTPAGITDPPTGFNYTDRVYSCGVFWSTDRNNQSLHPETPFLISPRDPGAFTAGWRDFITYRFEIYHTPSRSKVRIYEDDMRNGSTAVLVRDLTIVDSSYPRGRVAFFSNSQEQVDFGDFTFASLDGYSAAAGADQTLSAGGVATLSASAVLAVPPISCRWSAGGTTVASTCTATVSPAQDTIYTLTVTDDFGRVASDDLRIDVSP